MSSLHNGGHFSYSHVRSGYNTDEDHGHPKDISGAVEEAKNKLKMEVQMAMTQPVHRDELGKSELSAEDEERLRLMSRRKFSIEQQPGDNKTGVSVFYIVKNDQIKNEKKSDNETDSMATEEKDESDPMDVEDGVDESGDVPSQVFAALLSNSFSINISTETLSNLRRINMEANKIVTPIIGAKILACSKTMLDKIKSDYESFVPRRLTQYQKEKGHRFEERIKHFDNELYLAKSRLENCASIQKEIDGANKARESSGLPLIRGIDCLVADEYVGICSLHAILRMEKESLPSFFTDFLEGLPSAHHGSQGIREGYERFVEPPSPHFPHRQDTDTINHLNRARELRRMAVEGSVDLNHPSSSSNLPFVAMDVDEPEMLRAKKSTPIKPRSSTSLPTQQYRWLNDDASSSPPFDIANQKEREKETSSRQVGYDSPFEVDEYFED